MDASAHNRAFQEHTPKRDRTHAHTLAHTHTPTHAHTRSRTAVQLGAALPAGWIFDRYGGRTASLIGAVMAAAGLVLMRCLYTL